MLPILPLINWLIGGVRNRYSYKLIDKFIKDEEFGDLEEFRVRPKKTTTGTAASRIKG